MGLGGCYTCIKYLMFAFNFLFWILGCALLGIGIWIRVDPKFEEYLDYGEYFDYLYLGSYIIIGIGVLIMVLGFLGCCGAIRESQCMLATFFIFLFIIFAVLLGVGIWAIVEKDKLEGKVVEVLEEACHEYDNSETAKGFMDKIQTKLECCGASKGPADYVNKEPATCNGHTGTPCSDKLFKVFADNLIIEAGVAIGVGVVMLLGMIFSMLLCCAIREAS